MITSNKNFNSEYLISSLRALVELNDFLSDEKGRSLNKIFEKNPSLLKIFHSFIQETKESNAPLLIKNGVLESVEYEFIGRRKEGKKKIEVFSIVLKEEKSYAIISSSTKK